MSTLQQALIMSRNTGSAWSKKTASGARAWSGITISTDGQKIAACVSGGYIYTSANGGSTFTERTSPGSRPWVAISASSDGVKIFALSEDGYSYTSSDSGASWTAGFSGYAGGWAACASSANGTYILAVAMWDGVDNSYPTASVDSGANWTAYSGGGNGMWTCAAISSNGQKMVIADYNTGTVKRSTSGGASWSTLSLTSDYFLSMDCSDDGEAILLCGNSGTQVSTDGGANWSFLTPGIAAGWVACSADAGAIIGANYYGLIVATSPDAGVFWAEQTVGDSGYTSQKHVAISSDGAYFAVAVDGGYIYTAS